MDPELGLLAGDRHEALRWRPEERLQVVTTVVVQGRACSDDAELRAVRRQSQAVAQVPDDHGDLSALSAPVQVELVDDQGDDSVAVSREPSTSAFEDRLLDLSHEHDVQHRVVRHQDVRGGRHHVPARHHLDRAWICQL